MAQGVYRLFERFYRLYRTALPPTLTSSPLGSMLALAGMPLYVCFMCGGEHQVAASACAFRPIRWVWGRRWCARASGKGWPGVRMLFVTIGTLLSHGGHAHGWPLGHCSARCACAACSCSVAVRLGTFEGATRVLGASASGVHGPRCELHRVVGPVFSTPLGCCH